MKKRISHISPLQAGIVQGLVLGIVSIIFVPFILLGMLTGHGAFGVFAIFIPIIYAVMGFIMGVISAFVYNLVANWTGGIEMTLTDVP